MNHQLPSSLRGKPLLEALSSGADLSGTDHANLDGCELSEFSVDVLLHRHLTTLSLFDNRLSSVPAEVSQLSLLRTLNLAGERE